MTWTKGLRELTMPDSPEPLTDEEAAEKEEPAERLGEIPADDWRRLLHRRPNLQTDLLDAVERGRWREVAAIVGDCLLPPDIPAAQAS